MAWIFTGCKKMDRTYKEFVVPGGITYAQKATSPMANSGHNRIKISWLRGTDPTVVKARIYWTNYADSVEINIPSSGDTISHIIDNLDEQGYSFIIKTYDAKGNSSVPVEITSASYGEIYQSSLYNRPILETDLDTSGKEVTILWGGADLSNGAYAMDVKYTDTLGKAKMLRFSAKDSASTIPDMKEGTAYQYRTVYLPDSTCIDTFYTSYEENTRFLLNKSKWKVIDFSTEHPGDANLVTNVIDGNPGTRWHTWVDHSAYPHFVTVDMGNQNTIASFEIFRMTGDDRACNTFQLMVSSDNITWKDLGTFNFNRLIDDGQFYDIPSHPQARYFKFIGISGPLDYMVTGEISVYALGPQ